MTNVLVATSSYPHSVMIIQLALQTTVAGEEFEKRILRFGSDIVGPAQACESIGKVKTRLLTFGNG
jgi:hypothetical protein